MTQNHLKNNSFVHLKMEKSYSNKNEIKLCKNWNKYKVDILTAGIAYINLNRWTLNKSTLRPMMALKEMYEHIINIECANNVASFCWYYVDYEKQMFI